MDDEAQVAYRDFRAEKAQALQVARKRALDELTLSREAVERELTQRQYSIDPRTRQPYREFFVPLKRLRYLVACAKTPRGQDPPNQRDLDEYVEVGAHTFSRSRFYKQRSFQRDLDSRYFEMMHCHDSFCRTRVESTRRGMPYLAISFPMTKAPEPLPASSSPSPVPLHSDDGSDANGNENADADADAEADAGGASADAASVGGDEQVGIATEDDEEDGHAPDIVEEAEQSRS